MRRERRDWRTWAWVGVAGASAIAAACSFPSVTFEAVDEDTKALCPACDAGGVTETAEASPDAATAAEPYRCKGPELCDCDGDGYVAKGCLEDLAKLAQLYGRSFARGDCDDHDARVFPGQGFLDKEAMPGQPADWNCDGVEEHDPPQKIVCGGTGKDGCTGGRGFLTAPACGATETAYVCEAQTPDGPCVPVRHENARQLCR